MPKTLLILLVISLCATAAAAQDQPLMQPVGEPVPAQPQPVATAQPQPVATTEAPPPTAQVGRGIEYGAHLFVPVFLQSNELVSLNPGFGLHGRLGWEFAGGLTTELNIGFMFNGTDAAAVSSGVTLGEYSLFNFYVGAGARYAFLNPSAIVPFVGAGVALNFWRNSVSRTGPGGTSTESYGDTVATIGFNGLVGAAFEINPYFAIEAGVQANYTPPPKVADVPAQPELWLSPFIGGTLYY